MAACITSGSVFSAISLSESASAFRAPMASESNRYSSTIILLNTLSRFPCWCCWWRECKSRVLRVVSGVKPNRFFPRLSAANWSYHIPNDSNALLQTLMTRMLIPRCFSSKWLAATYCRTMLSSGFTVRKCLVMAEAPCNSSTTLTPRIAAGTKPTAERIEQRPPTPSGTG